MTATELNNRWSGFNIPKDYIGFYSDDGGILRFRDGLFAMQDLSLKNGASLMFNSFAIKVLSNSVVLENKQTFNA